MSIKHDKDSDLWHIVFAKSNHKHWIFKWVHPDYQHCYAVKSSPGDQYWVIVDGKHSHTEATIHPKELAPTVKDLVEDYTNIITIRVSYDILKPVHHLSVLSCVDVVKGLLGIRDFWLWTPRQLFRRLQNEQGTITR